MLLILSIILAWTLCGPQQTFITQMIWTKQGFTMISNIDEGWPINARTFLVDFNRSNIVLSNDQTASGWDSAFYQHPLFGFMDTFLFAGTEYELPFVVDYGTVINSRCKSCDGIFGLGRGSPLLDFFSSMSVGGFTTILNEYSLRSDFAQRTAAPCNFASATLCDLQVSVTRIDGKTGARRLLSNNTLLLLAPNVPETQLPNQMFLDVVSGLNTVKDKMDEWPDLEFCAVGGSIADGSPVCFIIPRRLILPTDRSYSELAIAPNDADYAQLGMTALRGLTVHYFLKSNSVGFSSEPVVLSVSTFSIFVTIISLVLLYCIAFTRNPVLPPSAVSKLRAKATNESPVTSAYEYSTKVRQVIEVLALTVLPILILLQDMPVNLWRSSPAMFLCTMFIVGVAWVSGIWAQLEYMIANINETPYRSTKQRIHLSRVAWLRSCSSLTCCILTIFVFSTETFVNGKVTMLMLLLSVTLNLVMLRTVLVLLQLAFVHWTVVNFLHIFIWLLATFASYIVTSATVTTPMARAILTNGSTSTWLSPAIFAFLILILSMIFQQAPVLYFLHFIEHGSTLMLKS